MKLRILKNERGQVLPMALILLAFGGLLVVPVLALTATNLNANHIVHQNTLELYAADAGVERVMWEILYKTNPPFQLPTGSEEKTVVTGLQINGKTVNATISKVPGQTNIYRITSIATSPDGHSSRVECLVDAGSKYSFLFDSAIVSAGKVTLKPNTQVHGNVLYGTVIDQQPGSIINGEVARDPTLSAKWPTEPELNDFYNVNSLPLLRNPPYSFYDSRQRLIDIRNCPPSGIGGFRTDGNLNIDNTGSQDATLKINGTIYVNGNLEFRQPGTDKRYTVDLNNQIIYAKGKITFPSNNVSLIGSGCIVAVGDVTVYPGTSNSSNDFILVLSLKGKAELYPSGNFYGCVAGKTESEIGAGRIITGPPPSFLFPGMGGGAGGGLGGKAKMLSYTINPQ